MDTPIKKLAGALKWKRKKPQLHEVLAVHSKFSMWNHKEELKIELVLLKCMDKHKDQLTNHTTTLSTTYGKCYIALVYQYQSLFIPSSLKWMSKSSIQSFDFNYQLCIYHSLCAIKHIWNKINWWNGVCWEHEPWRHTEDMPQLSMIQPARH